jgi:hypothetical protein
LCFWGGAYAERRTNASARQKRTLRSSTKFAVREQIRAKQGSKDELTTSVKRPSHVM